MARRGRQQGRGRQIGGGMRDRFQRIRDVNRTQLGIVLAALVLGITLFFPRFYPAAKRGPTCSNLAAPLGGNNRSVLAYTSDQRNNLKIDLELDSNSVRQNESLIAHVSFRNEDQGAVILYLPSQNPVPVNPAGVTQGLWFTITLNDGPIGTQGQIIPTAPNAFTDPGRLHMLGSGARCHEEFAFNLGQLNLPAGQTYRVRAFYRNDSDGDLLEADNAKNQGLTPTSSPFPEYLGSQGVWTGEVSSKEELFTIQQVQPASAPPTG